MNSFLGLRDLGPPARCEFESDEIVDSDEDEEDNNNNNNKTSLPGPTPPAKRQKVGEATDEDKTWWETEKPRLELTEDTRKRVLAQNRFWMNELSPEGLGSLEIRAVETNGAKSLQLYDSATATCPGLTLHDVMGVLKSPRLDGLGVCWKGENDNSRKFKLVLVPFYTPGNQALCKSVGGEQAQWTNNLLNQLPGSREMCAEAWTPRIGALITKVADLVWNFESADGSFVGERARLEKRLQGNKYDDSMKATKRTDARQDFDDNCFSAAEEHQWNPYTGDLFLKARVFKDSKYKGAGAHQDSSRFVFENVGRQGSDISPEEQTGVCEGICGGPSPKFRLNPIKFFSRDRPGQELPYGKGAAPNTVNLCDPPVLENDCVLVSVLVTLSMSVDGRPRIIFKLQGSTVHIWQRGPGPTASAMFAV